MRFAILTRASLLIYLKLDVCNDSVVLHTFRESLAIQDPFKKDHSEFITAKLTLMIIFQFHYAAMKFVRTE